MTAGKPAAVIVLAAGEGTRMKSALPKVLHTLAGRSLLGHVLHSASALDPERLVVVIRHGRDQVAEHVGQIAPHAILADQDEIKGTGRAVQVAVGALESANVAAHLASLPDGALTEPTAPAALEVTGSVLVLAGDVPLLNAEVLAELVATHERERNAITVLTTEVADATGYGRVLRNGPDGEVLEIVEHRDATPEQLQVREINSSVYVFDGSVLREGLKQLNADNAQGELYLTDVLGSARAAGHRVGALRIDDPVLVEGVNDRAQLGVLHAELNKRLLNHWMAQGVRVIDPNNTWIDVDVELAQDVTLFPGVQLYGHTTVGEGAQIGPDTTLTDVSVGAGAKVIRTHGSDSQLGDGVNVGPFAYLRPGTILGEGGKIGTFVETKNAQIGPGSKVPHLTYVGDALIGEGTNIGAGTIFVNYDGVNKHRTIIGNHARTGADNQLVAPVQIGDGAYTGAGSVIRNDVPAGSLAVSSGPQRNIEGWVLRARAETDAAHAAAKALAAEQQDDLSPQARAELDQAAHAGGTEDQGATR